MGLFWARSALAEQQADLIKRQQEKDAETPEEKAAREALREKLAAMALGVRAPSRPLLLCCTAVLCHHSALRDRRSPGDHIVGLAGWWTIGLSGRAVISVDCILTHLVYLFIPSFLVE